MYFKWEDYVIYVVYLSKALKSSKRLLDRKFRRGIFTGLLRGQATCKDETG